MSFTASESIQMFVEDDTRKNEVVPWALLQYNDLLSIGIPVIVI